MVATRALPRRRLAPVLCAGLVLASGAFAGLPAAAAAELVMFRMPGCSWCQAWDREVGEAYANSPEAKVAPLREVRLDRDRDGGLELSHGVRVTPTFVLAHDGVEVGRIVGYPGAAFFWGQLDELLEKLDQVRRRPAAPDGPSASSDTRATPARRPSAS